MSRFFTAITITASEITTMRFRETREFARDFKRLAKKFRTLSADLILFQKTLTKFPKGVGKHFHILTIEKNITIIKARFFCQSLKHNSLRIIYAYRAEDECLELIGIEFIELYFKGERESEDWGRIKEYLRNKN